MKPKSIFGLFLGGILFSMQASSSTSEPIMIENLPLLLRPFIKADAPNEVDLVSIPERRGKHPARYHYLVKAKHIDQSKVTDKCALRYIRNIGAGGEDGYAPLPPFLDNGEPDQSWSAYFREMIHGLSPYLINQPLLEDREIDQANCRVLRQFPPLKPPQSRASSG
jgi:hypothetical protein